MGIKELFTKKGRQRLKQNKTFAGKAAYVTINALGYTQATRREVAATNKKIRKKMM